MAPVSDLRVEELTPVGGSWSGLLFENPATGYPLRLTWAFFLDFSEVVRNHGSVSPNLAVDWVPAGTSSWRSIGGARFSADCFGKPIEATLYFFPAPVPPSASGVGGSTSKPKPPAPISKPQRSSWGASPRSMASVPAHEVTMSSSSRPVFSEVDRCSAM